MLKLFLPFALIVAASAAASAKTLQLGDGKPPVAEITIPDGWETTTGEGGFEATASDVYLSGEVFDLEDAAETSTVTSQFLTDHKIKLKQETRSQKAAKVAGLPAVETAWEATDADGPTKFRVDVVKVRDGKLLLLTYWRSEAGEKDHGAEVDTIMGSLKPAK